MDSEPPGRSAALAAYVSQSEVLVAWPYELGAVTLGFRLYDCFKLEFRLVFLFCFFSFLASVGPDTAVWFNRLGCCF